jgi:hypothetical protein
MQSKQDDFAISPAAAEYAKYRMESMTVGELQDVYGECDEPLAAAFAYHCRAFADAMIEARKESPDA